MEAQEFFMPLYEEDPVMSEAYYSRILSLAVDLGHTPSKDRIYAIDFEHKGNRYTETVGVVSPVVREVVLAILDCGDYCLTYTRNHGFYQGYSPMLSKPYRKYLFR